VQEAAGNGSVSLAVLGIAEEEEGQGLFLTAIQPTESLVEGMNPWRLLHSIFIADFVNCHYL
jgi:hypothetical protein